MTPSMPELALIVAVARNGVIGSGCDLPWRMSSDMRHFKAVTMGKPMIMGRKTFDSIIRTGGGVLPGRPHIVVTRQSGFAHDGVNVVSSLEEAVDRGRILANSSGVDEVMVIGGGEIYRQALDPARRIYLTEVHLDAAGDTRFSGLERDQWVEILRQEHKAGEKDCADYAFVVFERRPQSQP